MIVRKMETKTEKERNTEVMINIKGNSNLLLLLTEINQAGLSQCVSSDRQTGLTVWKSIQCPMRDWTSSGPALHESSRKRLHVPAWQVYAYRPLN